MNVDSISRSCLRSELDDSIAKLEEPVHKVILHLPAIVIAHLDVSIEERIIKDVMRRRFPEGEKPKNDRKEPAVGFKRVRSAEFRADFLIDEEIDPADFFDPEEFGYRRDLKSFRG